MTRSSATIPSSRRKIIKFNTLLANCVIFHTALDMTAVIRQLATDGWTITPTALTALSPYITKRVNRFGEYATDGLTDPPAAFEACLELPQHLANQAAAANMAA